MPTRTIEKITFIETAQQAQWFFQHTTENSELGHVLAITPHAAWACQRLSQPYLKIQDFVQACRRLDEYGAILPKYLEWEEWLDQWGQKAVPEFGKTAFNPAHSATFLLQFLHAEIWATAQNLRELFAAAQPKNVAFWSPRIPDIPWYLHPSVSALPAVLPSLAASQGIPWIDLADQAPELAQVSQPVLQPTPYESRVRWLKKIVRENVLLSEVKTLRSIGCYSYLRQWHSQAPEVLVSGFHYDLSPLVDELRRQGARVTQISDTIPPGRLLAGEPSLGRRLLSALKITGEQLLHESSLWEPLDQLGISHIELWSKPILFWWRKFVPELWLSYQSARRLHQRRTFSAAIACDAGGSTLDSAALNAAKNARVPRYIYQHGSSAGIDAKIWQTYLNHSDAFLVYGSGTADELAATRLSSFKSDTRLIPVGSARLDSLRQHHQPAQARKLRARLQGNDSRPLILYVPTSFDSYGRDVNDVGAYPDVPYFELQQRILSAWADNPQVRLVYKDFIVAHDLNYVMANYIQKSIPNAIVTRQRLTALIWVADAIVLDHVGTAVGEVLVTDKQLVVYMPQPNSASPQAKVLLRKRATVAENPIEFENAVRRLLQQRDYSELENPNSEFLEAYCTHSSDGHSAERAAAAVLTGIGWR